MESTGKIVMAHGSGGRATAELIGEIFAGAYGNEYLSQMEDASYVPFRGGKGSGLAVTTDSFVVRPIEFPGGDIGRLAVCGTVNDLAARGAKPAYLTAGFILEEGLEIETLRRVAHSMAETAMEAGVMIVAGDTKVVEGSGGMYINTAGIGFYEREYVPGIEKISEGDAILLSGSIGEHHAAVLSARLNMETEIVSDVAPLGGLACGLNASEDITVHAMRDVTRGGLATVLAEMAEARGLLFEIEEELLPVKKAVKSFAGLLGLDPLYMGNEGKMVVILPQADAEKALKIIRQDKYGKDAVLIGRVESPKDGTGLTGGKLVVTTKLGGKRVLGVMTGEGLPRIC